MHKAHSWQVLIHFPHLFVCLLVCVSPLIYRVCNNCCHATLLLKGAAWYTSEWCNHLCNPKNHQPTRLITIGACNTRATPSIIRQWPSPCIDIHCAEYADMKGWDINKEHFFQQIYCHTDWRHLERKWSNYLMMDIPTWKTCWYCKSVLHKWCVWHSKNGT